LPAVKPKFRQDLTVVELDGEAVIYDDESGELHHLNPTATIVFNLCDGTATIKELSAEIAAAFSQPADEVERQVRTLLREFRKVNLLDGNLMDGKSPKGKKNGKVKAKKRG
jgi:PqqD family protein of HPr-rel-A system